MFGLNFTCFKVSGVADKLGNVHSQHVAAHLPPNLSCTSLSLLGLNIHEL